MILLQTNLTDRASAAVNIMVRSLTDEAMTASATAMLNVTELPAPMVLVIGGIFPYDGQPHPATGTVTSTDGEDLGPLTFAYNGSPDVPVTDGPRFQRSVHSPGRSPRAISRSPSRATSTAAC